MATRFELPVQGSTATSGNTTFVVDGYKLFTGQVFFQATGTSPACTVNVKVLGDSGSSASTAHTLKTQTFSASGGLFYNNNDGDGCPMTAYSIYVEWSGLADGAITIGQRKEY